MMKNPDIVLRPNPNGDWPQVDPTAFIDPTARIIGNVHVGPEVFIGPFAVVRADETDEKGRVQPVEIEAQCNIQDGVIIHALGGTQVTVGRRTSLAHGCVVHGPCTTGPDCFIGFRAVVYNATLAERVFVGMNTVVQGVDLVADSLVPAAVSLLSREDVVRLVSPVTPADLEFMARVVNANLALVKGYLALEEQKPEEHID